MYQETSKPRTLAESKIIQAFGVPLLNKDEGPINDQFGKYQERMIRLKCKQYRREKLKYNLAAELRRATFTPIIATWGEILDHEPKD